MPNLVQRVAARDRALLEWIALDDDTADVVRAGWRLVTHAGGAWMTLLVSLGPLCFESSLHDGAIRATWILIVSHLAVQLVKRSVERPRPQLLTAVLDAPDRYSFPSGHAAAALSIALGYGGTYPEFAVPLFLIAAIVGASRVVLGVHYPADVLAGQVIAMLTSVSLSPLL